MKKYRKIQIGIASPEEIRSWAYREEDGFFGEVKKHETINYRTLKPEREGLFCEVIFGPTKDYQCACGKSRKTSGDTKICEKCHVEITESKVRREKMGFIELAAPVVHTWYLRSIPSKIGTLLNMKTTDVDDIVYLASYIITEVSERVDGIELGMILTEQEHSLFKRKYPFKYKAKTGAEAIKYLLENLDLQALVDEIREELKTAKKNKREGLVKRLDIAEAFLNGNKRLEKITTLLCDNVHSRNEYEQQLHNIAYKAAYLNKANDAIISTTDYVKRKNDLTEAVTGDKALAHLYKNLDLFQLPERIEKELTQENDDQQNAYLLNRLEIANEFIKAYEQIAKTLNIDKKTVYSLVCQSVFVITELTDKVSDLKVGSLIPEQKYNAHPQKNLIKVKTGVEAISYLYDRQGLKEDKWQVMDYVNIEELIKSAIKPEWMVMEAIPVIPPDLRPMVQLDGGRFATTDLNDLYRRIINRNTRLKKQFEQRAPDLIVKNEKRMLQEAVDALIDNRDRSRRKKQVLDKNRPLKSLSDLLRGKQGRFRQNLLGKRVDYSGRSVIVVGPDLKMYQCGIPREMALILFKPFIINYLRQKDAATNPEGTKDKAGIRRAKELIERGAPQAMDALERIVTEHPVLLNRAPTLHRLSIQAFEPVLVEGKAIRLHPLVTTAFNADFDGDQMPVHVPLSEEAQAEARLLMLASKNILAPKDGKPIVTPSQDMILGNYYLTIERHQPDREGRIFKDVAEVEMAYENGEIDLHTRFLIPARRLSRPLINLNEDDENYLELKALNEERLNSYLITTFGKIIFNSVFPDKFPYVNEPELDNLTKETSPRFLVKPNDSNKSPQEIIKELPLVSPFKKKFLSLIISEIFRQAKLVETSRALDQMKDLGFKYSTVAGITISAFDIAIVEEKEEILQEADMIVKQQNNMFRRGLTTESERKRNVLRTWTDAKNKMEVQINNMMKKNATTNDIFMMADSGARGSASNFTQLAGMRGLMAKPNGEAMEIPIRSSFREGMSMSEFFISTHGARKGSTDTALKTAESGYLTRRLVDVSQDVTITCEDCGTDKGIVVSDITDGKSTIESLKDRIVGRFASKPIYTNGHKLIVDRNGFISDSIAQKIIKAGIKEVEIRSLLTCDCENGVCVKCYGSDLSTNEIVEKGEVVGIVAAQSIGEPGTQLTMRTFHSGGVAGEDITQGLPRIQELFEAREPKRKDIISEIKGTVEAITPKPDNRFEVVIKSTLPDNDKTYLTDSGKHVNLVVGQKVEAGDAITGDKEIIHPKELLRVASVSKVEQYILKEVQKVYRSQGVEISDKHVEIIIKQMLQKVQVINSGDTDLLPGTYISKPEAKKIIAEMLDQGKHLPILKPVLLGITRASLRADSFLSAASFQETTRVLTEAAIRGKVDTLEGLKENIIIGGLIPAGTGLVDTDDFSIESLADEAFDLKAR